MLALLVPGVGMGGSEIVVTRIKVYGTGSLGQIVNGIGLTGQTITGV